MNQTASTLEKTTVRAAVPPRRSLLKALPNFLVLLGLIGFLVAGHMLEWSLPRFSALFGTPPATTDWCEAHSVPESICVECNTELLPRGHEFGWCPQHGVHDCPLCHPEVAELPKTPQVTDADRRRTEQALKLIKRPENNDKSKVYRRRIQFTSNEAIEKAGIKVEPALTAPMIEAITASGEIDYDPTRVARLSSRVSGVVWRVEKQVGDPVRRNDVLALIDAAEVGRTKAEYLQAQALVDLKVKLVAGNAAAASNLPLRTLQEQETALREARIRLLSARQALANLGLSIPAESWQGMPEEQLLARLRFLGLPEPLTRSFDPQTATANLYPLRAPLDGVVVARTVVEGETVETARSLFVIADVTRMWLTLDVRLEDAHLLTRGLPVRFRPDGEQVDVRGPLSWISTEVDQKTRTLQIRADLDNRAGLLHAHTFGAGRIVLREEPKAVVVPNSAVHWAGDCNIVFVRDRNYFGSDPTRVFHVRQVRPGVHNENNTEIIVGLLPYESVAAQGSAVLRAILLKNDIGDGCCGCHP